MTRLYLVRHGEAAAGFGDHADPGLSVAGWEQAQVAARALGKLGGLDAQTSPLARAKQTAQAYVHVCAAPLAINPAFAEVPAPVPLAQRRAWLMGAFPTLADHDGPSSRWSDKGPAILAWREDVIAAARAIERDTFVFTHFIPINALISAAQGVEDTIVAWPGYTSVTILETNAVGLRLIAPPAEAITVVL